MTQQTNHQRPSTHAVVFHSVAASFLGSQGFTLVGDPGIVGMYGGSAALYRTKRGLSLWIMFEPYDGAAAWMTCGREWTPKEGAPFLSNAYSKLAQRFGVDLPLDYPIANGEQPSIVAERIVADLKRSLPIVVSKVSMTDLLAIENEEPSGAAASAVRSFGANYATNVDISDFSES
jgi:hypothetical protein